MHTCVNVLVLHIVLELQSPIKCGYTFTTNSYLVHIFVYVLLQNGSLITPRAYQHMLLAEFTPSRYDYTYADRSMYVQNKLNAHKFPIDRSIRLDAFVRIAPPMRVKHFLTISTSSRICQSLVYTDRCLHNNYHQHRMPNKV